MSGGSSGEEANDFCAGGVISADGHFVVFSSPATNLVRGEDTNGVCDGFVHDRLTGETQHIGVGDPGEQANGPVGPGAINADGRHIAFVSCATNLVLGDTNGVCDAFAYDRLTGVTERVSVDSSGAQGNDESCPIHVSANGRYVLFGSFATNLVPGDTNGAADAFVHDRGPRYEWLGFLPPVEGATRAFKRGSTVPLKFRITENGQPAPNASSTLTIYYLVNGAPSGEAEAVSTAAGDLGDKFCYSADGDLYIFNLSTGHPSYIGYYTYLAEVALDDGSTQSIQFSLK